MNGRSILEFAPAIDESMHVACEHIRYRRSLGWNLPTIVEDIQVAFDKAGYHAGTPRYMTGDDVTYWLAGLWKDYVKFEDNL